MFNLLVQVPEGYPLLGIIQGSFPKHLFLFLSLDNHEPLSQHKKSMVSFQAKSPIKVTATIYSMKVHFPNSQIFGSLIGPRLH